MSIKEQVILRVVIEEGIIYGKECLYFGPFKDEIDAIRWFRSEDAEYHLPAKEYILERECIHIETPLKWR